MTRITKSQQQKIVYVAAVAGCTEKQAHKELIAEEWCVADAIINMVAFMQQSKE